MIVTGDDIEGTLIKIKNMVKSKKETKIEEIDIMKLRQLHEELKELKLNTINEKKEQKERLKNYVQRELVKKREDGITQQVFLYFSILYHHFILLDIILLLRKRHSWSLIQNPIILHILMLYRIVSIHDYMYNILLCSTPPTEFSSYQWTVYVGDTIVFKGR